jgi:hypothetical protein
MTVDPLSSAKADYRALIDRISVADSPVGIDAQYTHAVIITYLQQISDRLGRIEEQLRGRGQ